jgi:hypothetical protein
MAENNIRPDMQSQLILSLQKQVLTLKAQIRQLQRDNNELEQMLTIALEDNASPIVISRDRLKETLPGFILEHNYDGDLLVNIRRKSVWNR